MWFCYSLYFGLISFGSVLKVSKIYQIGKVASEQGAFYVMDWGLSDGKPYFEVYFKRTGKNPEHYLHDGFDSAKEACMAVDSLVRKWLL